MSGERRRLLTHCSRLAREEEGMAAGVLGNEVLPLCRETDLSQPSDVRRGVGGAPVHERAIHPERIASSARR